MKGRRKGRGKREEERREEGRKEEGRGMMEGMKGIQVQGLPASS